MTPVTTAGIWNGSSFDEARIGVWNGAEWIWTAPSFSPLDLGWHTAFWAEDPNWSHPVNGGQVSQWDDATGNARHAVQATSGSQPFYRASVAALNNQPAVDFVTTMKSLKTAAWTAVPQPWTLVAVGRFSSDPGTTQYMFDGSGASNRSILNNASSGGYRFYVGTGISGGTDDTNAHLFVGLANGASSLLAVDGTTLVSGNAGSHTQTGLTMGTSHTQVDNSFRFFGEIAFAGIFPGDVTADASWADFKAWVTSHYGITVA